MLSDKGYTYGLIQFTKPARAIRSNRFWGWKRTLLHARHDKDSSSDTRRYPLVLLAETDEGYENLLKLATRRRSKLRTTSREWTKNYRRCTAKRTDCAQRSNFGAIPQAALAEDPRKSKGARG